MWDLHRPGIELVAPASQGGFTGPPGKPSFLTFELGGWPSSCLDALPSAGSPPCLPDSQVPPPAAPIPSCPHQAGSCSLLCLPECSSFCPPLEDDLWIFPPRFLVSRSSGWEGRVQQKQFWPPPPSSCCHFKGSCRISWDFKKNPAFSLL